MSFTRRNFVKQGLLSAGIGFLTKRAAFGEDCPEEVFENSSPIPLNNVLSDFKEVNHKFGYGLVRTTVCDPAGWELKRRSIGERARLMLGNRPDKQTEELKVTVHCTTHRKGYRELKIEFPGENSDLITGYLLVPGEAKAHSPVPAVLALHSTGPGASQTVGLVPMKNRCYGMELAERGYVVLAIDVVSAGERVYKGSEPYYTGQFYKEFPDWSVMDKMISDHQRGIDYLCSFDFVNPDKIGCIGHSLGGYNSFFLQAFDSRIKAAVVSCGFSPMGKTNSPFQFARDDWFVHFNPVLRKYIGAGMIPCDMHEFMALCAPRPLFCYAGRQDAIYCQPSARKENHFAAWWKTVDEALTQVEDVYRLTDASHCFVRADSEGGHDFPPEIRSRAYQWLDQWLGRQ